MSIFPMTLRFTSNPKRLRKIVYPTCTSSAIYVHFFAPGSVSIYDFCARFSYLSQSDSFFSFFLFTIPQIGSLIIESTRKKDSGNYSCSPSNSPPITVSLHVINGKSELGTMANCRSTWYHSPLLCKFPPWILYPEHPSLACSQVMVSVLLGWRQFQRKWMLGCSLTELLKCTSEG